MDFLAGNWGWLLVSAFGCLVAAIASGSSIMAGLIKKLQNDLEIDASNRAISRIVLTIGLWFSGICLIILSIVGIVASFIDYASRGML
jgi:hypothetical protein